MWVRFTFDHSECYGCLRQWAVSSVRLFVQALDIGAEECWAAFGTALQQEVQYIPITCSEVPCSAVSHSAVQCSGVFYSAV